MGRRSFATLTVSSQNLVAAMLTTSMSAFVKSRLSFLTCTCFRSPWMTWPRPQPDPLSLEALTSYLKVIPLLTFIVTEGPLPRKDKLNSSVMKTIQLRRPLLTSPSLYIFLFYCGNYFENNRCVTLTLPTKFFGFFIYKFICFHSI